MKLRCIYVRKGFGEDNKRSHITSNSGLFGAFDRIIIEMIPTHPFTVTRYVSMWNIRKSDLTVNFNS